LFLNDYVWEAAQEVRQALNIISTRAQHMFGMFVRLVLSIPWDKDTGVGGAFSVPSRVWCRLRTHHRRCFSLANPASKMHALQSVVEVVNAAEEEEAAGEEADGGGEPGAAAPALAGSTKRD